MVTNLPAVYLINAQPLSATPITVPDMGSRNLTLPSSEPPGNAPIQTVMFFDVNVASPALNPASIVTADAGYVSGVAAILLLNNDAGR